MATYSYTAYKNGTNEVVKGKVDADSLREARNEVRKKGLVLTHISEDNQNLTAREVKKSGIKPGVMPKSLNLYCL